VKKDGDKMVKTLILLMITMIFFVVSCGVEDEDSDNNISGVVGDLVWSGKSKINLDWHEAMQYCENFSVDGNSGWRLPTVSELRTLIQNCPATETGGFCGAEDGCLSWDNCNNDACNGCYRDESGKYSVFGDICGLWSSSETTDRKDRAWRVSFMDGRVYVDFKKVSLNARCVK
jgi:uncharacterized protein (TIGR02145 family)